MLHQTSHKSCLPRRRLQSMHVGNCSESSIAGYLTSIQEPCQLSPADRCCRAEASEADLTRTYHCFAKLSVGEAPLLGTMAGVVVGRRGNDEPKSVRLSAIEISSATLFLAGML